MYVCVTEYVCDSVCDSVSLYVLCCVVVIIMSQLVYLQCHLYDDTVLHNYYCIILLYCVQHVE
jgi:hypothetical protein